jgi:nucleoside-diphosphate-sugar epimerase
MTIETVAVTGGNGKIGEEILRECSDAGYRVVNVARGKQREDVSDGYRRTDLLDAGQVYGSLTAADADAVIHMGTIPGPTGSPGYVCYESNTMSSYHVLEAATELGLEAVCLASSINAIGASYQEDPVEVDYLPIDEAHRRSPRDPYAMSKHAIEVTGDGFGRIDDAPSPIGSLRYPWVATGEEIREAFAEPERTLETVDSAHNGRQVLFSYVHIADAARAARKVIEADYEGHEVFWAVAADTTMETDSATLADEVFPDAEVRQDLEGHESLIDIGKAERLLDWVPERSWRDLA